LRAAAAETEQQGQHGGQTASRPPSSSSSAGNAVSSAVRSLNSLSDFDSGGGHNSTFESYAVTDSLLSGERTEENPVKTASKGPLMDFRSAFSDVDGARHASDLGGFLHDPLGMNQEDTQKALQASLSQTQSQTQQKTQSGQQSGMAQHPVDLNPMDFIEHDVVVNPSTNTAAHGPR